MATFTNPVFTDNFPDPGAILVDGTWYAYGTNNAAANVPVLTSPDLVTWTGAGDVLPEVGKWAEAGNTWAPEVIAADGGYLLYYTARSRATNRQCIGVARATEPQGPFVDDADEPLICQADEGGSIDASPYADESGALWLHWKNDGNALGRPTHLYGSRLSKDGRTLEGKTVRLLTNDAAWEDHVIEAPQLVRHDGKLFLFYSANAFDKDVYAVGYAECDSPLGPCRKASENPILRTSPAAAGPGHSFLVTTPAGETWLLYHAWPPEAIGSVVPGRQLWLDRVDWIDGRPVVQGPTTDPQPVPR
ncbi:glycoside hydrolase family protein [Actinoplanes friuliensis DSM 7358]|uniref:Glycoside hydrolase family protein n=1 Tax=Actinoplanes friuliensis DSM 7358 TaxID=1246995 RepID=U5WDT7_9ACTN|nr:glycoside hydrolase family protein [Actinoplanes friuliensis DSM 7358]